MCPENERLWEISRHKKLDPEFLSFVAETKLETPLDFFAYSIPSLGRFLERWVPFLVPDGYKKAQQIFPNS